MSNSTRPAHRTHDVVVGVDGTPASTNALRYARADAVRSGGRVEVFTYPTAGTELDTAYTDTLGDEVLGCLGAAVAGAVVARRRPG